MHHRNIVFAILVRMRVFFSRLSVRCPTGMAYTHKPRKVIINKFFLKFGHFAHRPLNNQSTSVRRQ